MIDLSLPIRMEVLAHLENDADVTSIVPSDRIYSMAVPSLPEWPYIRYGSPISTGFEASCWNGSSGTITIHVFSETTEAMSGEDQAATIAAYVVSAMGDFKPSGFGIVSLEWSNTTLLQDDTEAAKFHAVIEFTLTAVKRQ